MINVNRQANDFRFGGNTNIGTADAADDRLLSETFFDNGSLDLVMSVEAPESIVVGRTGSGKTALIEKLNEKQHRAIDINPDELALGYLVDSTLLRFFYESGIKMDMFYKLLWNHIFIVQILKVRYNIENEVTRLSILDRFKDFLSGNKGRTEAVNYLLDWGDKFWLGTEERVKEVINKLESQVQQSVGADAKKAMPAILDLGVKAEVKNDQKMTEEVKLEIINRGREVVSRIQTQRIQEIVRLLDTEILQDRQKRYYITIDKLDEGWVNDDLRYHLIKSLIEVARDLNNRISNLKIVIALRRDLIARVFEKTQDSGFQEEKFNSLYIDLRWSPRELESLLKLRVDKMISSRPTSRQISMKDILPGSVNNVPPLEYLITRTMLRPRDLIIFFNLCAKHAAGKPKIAASDITQAEIEYSQSRLEALQYEWGTDYPNIGTLIQFMRSYPASFTVGEISKKFRDSALELLTRKLSIQDEIYKIISDKFSDEEPNPMVESCLAVLYRIGAIGVRPVQSHTVYWSFKSQNSTIPSFNVKSVYYIHPSLWATLNIKPVDSKIGIYG
ncbi:P-loop ATPase, Sll1717 family [Deinococcus radiotolerans]|uniref:P-loop ATPase, Sll1717 family n=1 Tax=Deinococcus radiotolerans TaxID=1309407 RepID=UPI0016642457|nr:hypothetical protein [Deinococcus radiotolerans]